MRVLMIEDDPSYGTPRADRPGHQEHQRLDV
jgi:hypothetical protein